MIYESSIHQHDTAFYTDDPIYIYLLENYVRHDILVNRIVRRTGKEMDGWGTRCLFAPNIRKANFSNYYVKYGLFLLQQRAFLVEKTYIEKRLAKDSQPLQYLSKRFCISVNISTAKFSEFQDL